MVMRSKYKVVIIGGGIVGTATAFYLAKNGLNDVVVIEKEYLSSGSTGRCGGGIRQQWRFPEITSTFFEMYQASVNKG